MFSTLYPLKNNAVREVRLGRSNWPKVTQEQSFVAEERGGDQVFQTLVQNSKHDNTPFSLVGRF